MIFLFAFFTIAQVIATEVVIEDVQLIHSEWDSSEGSDENSSVSEPVSLDSDGKWQDLSSESGLVIQGEHSGRGRVFLRGYGSEHLLFSWNSVPLNYGSSPVFLSDIPPQLFDGVTVYQGGSSKNQSNGKLGGNLDFQTRYKNNDHWISQKIGSFGSYETTANFSEENLQIRLGRSHSQGDFSYQSDSGTENNKSDDARQTRRHAKRENIYGLSKYQISPKAWIKAIGFKQHQELPDRFNSFDGDGRKEMSYSLISTELPVFKKSNMEFFLGGYAKNEEHEFFDISDSFGNQTQGIKLEDQIYQGQLKSIIDLYPLNLEAIVERISESWKREDSAREQNLARDEMNLHLLGEVIWSRSSLFIKPSLKRVRDGENAVETVSLLEVGSEYSFSKKVVGKIQLNLNQKEPDFFSKYGEGVRFISNPELRSERSRSLQTQWKLKGSLPILKYEMDLLGHYDQLDDKIVFTYDNRGIGRSSNIDSVEQRGAKFELIVKDRSEAFTLRNSFYFLDTHNTSTIVDQKDKELPGRYRYQYFTSFSWGGDNWELSPKYTRKWGMYYDSANLIQASEFETLDFQVKYRYQKIDLSLRLFNLLAAQNEEVIGMPDPGRSFSLSGRYRF